VARLVLRLPAFGVVYFVGGWFFSIAFFMNFIKAWCARKPDAFDSEQAAVEEELSLFGRILHLHKISPLSLLFLALSRGRRRALCLAGCCICIKCILSLFLALSFYNHILRIRVLLLDVLY
jgi:hypothetical protein